MRGNVSMINQVVVTRPLRFKANLTACHQLTDCEKSTT